MRLTAKDVELPENMMMKRSSVVGVAFLVACVTAIVGGPALAQTDSKARSQAVYPRPETPAKDGEAASQPPPSAGPEDASARWEPVLMVTSVEVIRSTHGHELDIVRVRGLTSTDGWDDPQLVPLTKGTPPDGVLDLLLVAEAPSNAMDPTGFSTVDAVFVVEPQHPYKGIRVHGATNRVALQALPGYAEVSPIRNDCAQCVGKYFVAKGAPVPAGRSAADVVNEADLPSTLRVIKDSEGIGKLEVNPNRLTLLLDDDGRIEIAIWD
jgi:hypothetical protein